MRKTYKQLVEEMIMEANSKSLDNSDLAKVWKKAQSDDMTEGVGAYTVKKTKVKITNAADDGKVKITYYDILLDGSKKVGEMEHDDYFGEVEGTLYGKRLPTTAIGFTDIQAWLHRFLKSKKGAKFIK